MSVGYVAVGKLARFLELSKAAIVLIVAVHINGADVLKVCFPVHVLAFARLIYTSDPERDNVLLPTPVNHAEIVQSLSAVKS